MNIYKIALDIVLEYLNTGKEDKSLEGLRVWLTQKSKK